MAALVCVLAAGGALLLWALVQWARVTSHWARRGVPSEPRGGPHPVLGSLTTLYRENFGSWMRALYARHAGSPYVGIWLFWRPALVINSPELAARVLVKDSVHFRDHSFGASPRVDPMGSLNIFLLKDPTWTQVRRRLTTMFTSAKLRALHPLYSSKSKELVERIRKHNEDSTPLELRSLFADYTTDVIGAVTLGVPGEATLTGDSALRHVTRYFMQFSVWRGFCWAAIFFWPALATACCCTMFPRAATDFLQRLLAVTRGGELRPVLDRIKQDAQTGGFDASEKLLAAQAVILVQAGFDTTASALSFTIYELAHHPHIQERVYSEVCGVMDALGHDDFDADALNSMTYLKACIKETLRMYPVLGWLERRCAAPYRLDGRVALRPGDIVFVNGNGLHYDPSYFPEPERYNPDRFLPENEASIPAFTYMPFGEGPRICIGKRFAELTSRYALARLVRAYRVTPAAGTPQPRAVQLEKRGLLLTPGQPLYVRFEPRHRQ